MSKPSSKEKTELVIGIPCYNNESTIKFVAEQIDKGLRKFYPRRKALILAASGPSKDNTEKAFLETKTRTPKKFYFYKGKSGKGSALKSIFEIAVEKEANAIALFDADLRSIRAEWIKLMVGPILQGNDFVEPYYARYKYDGTITNQICFPLVYSLLCANIRQPIGGEFALSPKFAEFLLEKKWSDSALGFGIDIFMTCNALLNDFNVVQNFLGVKTHDAREPSGLRNMFKEVVGTLFSILAENREKWLKLQEVSEVPLLSEPAEIHPASFEINLGAMKDAFVEGREKYRDFWLEIMERQTFDALAGMEEPIIGKELWARIVLDHLFAFMTGKKQSIESLLPLWIARNYSFVQETATLADKEAEEKILEQASYFFKERSYLLEKLEK